MTQPTPIEKRRRLGNPAHRPMPNPGVSLAPATGVPQAPTSLGPAALQVWARVWRYAGSWISPDTDVALVVRYAEMHDLRTQLVDVIRRDGLEATGSQGQPKTHPALTSLLDLDARITKYEGLLGLTPADRARLGLAEIRKASALEQLLADRDGPN